MKHLRRKIAFWVYPELQEFRTVHSVASERARPQKVNRPKSVSVALGFGERTNATFTPYNTATLVRLASHYCQHISRSEATVSEKIAGHARLFSRLRDGKGCNVQTFNNAMAWFAKNWPADLEWPSDVPRPARAKPPP